jgi:acyl carrier protein
MSLQQDIKSFILQNFLFTTDAAALTDTDSLLQKGIVDSTGILELIMHLEETYGIKVLDEEMLPANLDTVEAIAAFVARKRGG